MPLNGYRNNPFDDTDINYLKTMYYNHFPCTYNHLLHIDNRQMTTKQVTQLYNNLIILAFENSATVSIGQTDNNRIWKIYHKINNAVKREAQIRKQTAMPKSCPQPQFPQYNLLQYNLPQYNPSQYNYSVQAQPERFTFPPDQEQSLSDEELAERIKLASEYESKEWFGGKHPLDAFFAEQDIAKLLNQPFLDKEIYGNIRINPLDNYLLRNIKNGKTSKKSRKHCYYYQ